MSMTESIKLHEYKSPVGNLLLGDYLGKLVMSDWKYRKKREEINARIADVLEVKFETELTPLHSTVIQQLDEYFQSKRTSFDLPLLFIGSEFQRSVWKALTEIPFGQTMSYLTLSRNLGDEKAIRAVASANGANAISIIVPCHRIIGSDGSLTGYAGGLPAKKKLLMLEGSLSQMELF